MNGRVGNPLQSFLPIALVVSWLMLAKRKEGEFLCSKAWYSVLAAKISQWGFFFVFLGYVIF